MGIQSFAGSSVSTEGIVTVKITGTLNTQTLPVPFSPGNYRIDTGFSGSLRVAFLNSAASTLSEFTFATTSFFTITDTATQVVIQAPQAAINGIITVQQLKRGVVSGGGWKPIQIAATGSLQGASLQCWNNRVYIIGGNDSGSWDGVTGSPAIQYWDKSSATTTVVRAANSDIAGSNASVIIGDNIYFHTHKKNPSTFRRFNLTTNTLADMAGKPWANSLHGLVATADGSRIYMIGAYESGGNNARSAYYNVSANSWTSIADVPSGEYNANIYSIDPDNSNIINVFGNSGEKWYRYSISGNTYTDTGYTAPVCYTNNGVSITAGKTHMFKVNNAGTRPNTTNFGFYRTTGSIAGASATQPYIVPNNIYSPLPEDGGGFNSSTTAFAIDSEYLYYHATNSQYLWYTPLAPFLAKNGLV